MSDKTTQKRKDNLGDMLRARVAEMQSDLSTRIRAARSDGADKVSDTVDYSDAVIQGEMDYALIQMKTETIARANEALVRLEAGSYGSCSECGLEISQVRLQALPFAVRCKSCEESRETRSRQPSERRAGFVFDVVGS